MKTLILLCLLPVPLLADAPKKPLPSRYTVLHTSSPFTTPTPPVIAPNAPVVNPLEDWVLGGVTKFPDGYFVILINKKKPEEKTIIQPGMHSEFEVLEVKEGGMDYTATTVKLRYGSSQGTVTFDQKLLTISAPSQNSGQQGQPEQGSRPTTPGFPPGLQPNGGGDRPSPRQRTIVPPTPGQAPQIQPRR